jgi:acyl dehydratase
MSNDLEVKATNELVVEDLDRREFVRYAGASGDFNPVHYDDSVAERAGHDEVFGQGMLVAGIASDLITDWVEIDRLVGFRVRFVGQVWPGATVVVSGEVTELIEDGRAEINVIAKCDDGETLITGEATVER